jgi:hypothetical protein
MRTFDDVRTARRQARRLSHGPAPVRVCWDLDNTLVDSGTLLRAGRALEDAIVEAAPVPNMLELFRAMRSALPEGGHVIVSARLREMRPATLTWLEQHDVLIEAAAVCFVPYVEAKPMIWTRLARGSKLVIVDDLSYNHEGEQVAVNARLVAIAERLARVYVGVEDIRRVSADSRAIEHVVERARGALTA